MFSFAELGRWLNIASKKIFTYSPNINLKRNFITKYSTRRDLNILRQALETGLAFIVNEDKKVIDYISDEEIYSHFNEHVPAIGVDLSEVLTEFKEHVMSGAVRQASARYLAFPDSGNSLAGNVADILAGLTNQNLIATTKSAPTATFVEIQVLLWLRELIGYDKLPGYPKSAIEVGGIMTTGGTLANATAILVARCKAFPDSRRLGLTSTRVKPILIVAGETMFHYSHVASFWWLGLGEENIVYVETNEDYTLNIEDLERKIVQYNDGVHSKIIAVIGQAGNSRTTTIERLDRIVQITRKYGVWLHIDACHGGVLLFSEKHRAKLRGVEFADSISIDPHKGLCIPYNSSAVFFRNIEDLRLISKSTDITIKKGSYDLGQVTPFMGSRRFDSLKLWFLIKHLGKQGIASFVDHRFELARQWKSRIDASAIFTSMNDVELNSVVFTISPKKITNMHPSSSLSVQELNMFNQRLHDDVYKEGFLCVHTFDIKDYADQLKIEKASIRALGVTLGNPSTRAEDFEEYISYLEKKAIHVLTAFDSVRGE